MSTNDETTKRIRGNRKFTIADGHVRTLRRRVRRPLRGNLVEEITLRKAHTPRGLIKAWINSGILVEVENEKLAAPEVQETVEPVVEAIVEAPVAPAEVEPTDDGEIVIRTLGDSINAAVTTDAPPKKRGRPKGSVNSPKKEAVK